VGVLSYLDDRETTSATANPSLILGAVVPALLPPVTGTRGSGLGASQVGGDPGGIRTRDLDLERVASLARLDDGVPGPLCVRNGSGMIAGPLRLDNRTTWPKLW
jgi:hypothetical protein